jgi:NADPH-dependent 2,4-dienoyl-CoA reductase/sulfur reductase-like enzyme
VRKIADGEEARIRPCVGATYCLDRIYEGGEALCIHNAATGREGQIPHEIAKAEIRRKAVVVGAGPAGLEAARVLAERGHAVDVLEATGKAGGQVNLLIRNPRRKEMIGIIDWRLAELERLGVRIHYDVYAEATDVLDLEPDLVVIATGGIAQQPELDAGDELVTSSWDILAGSVKAADTVLLFDDNGGHPGMSAAEVIARSGAELELVSPERFFAPEMGGMNHVPYARTFAERNVRVTINTRLKSVRRDGNSLVAVLGSDFDDGAQWQRRVSQVVVEHGTLANDGLYLEMKPFSRNLGAVDYSALIDRQPPLPQRNREGRFDLVRIGDAVSSRNIHAAIYDALRLCSLF